MKLRLSTNVRHPPEVVWKRFDQQLFEKLAPPFPRLRLIRFDGSEAGSIVEAELNFLLFKQNWQSLITDSHVADDEIYFIDQGKRLPFFLKTWHHRHRLIRTATGTKIVDDIEYRSPTVLLDYLLLPIMWLQFAYRKPIYRREFR